MSIFISKGPIIFINTSIGLTNPIALALVVNYDNSILLSAGATVVEIALIFIAFYINHTLNLGSTHGIPIMAKRFFS